MDPDEQEANRVTSSLAAFAIVLLFIVLGLFLVHHLHDNAALEDCIMSGRTNCLQPIPDPR